MGKYMRKSKATGGGVALVEVTSTHTAQAALGVRTRARVALERSGAAAEAGEGGGGSYLQLRSRAIGRQMNVQKVSRSSRLKGKGAGQKKEGKEKVNLDGGEKVIEKEENLQGNDVAEEENKEGGGGQSNKEGDDLGVDDAFFGENVLELEGRGRNTRESTPCELIRTSDSIIRTPGSSTRPRITTEDNNRENSIRRNIPTTNEMNEFFKCATEQQQKEFIKKYNFDPVNEKPLPGRFQWEKMNP